MEKQYCTSCGQQLPNDAAFCSRCGTPVSNELSVKPQVADQPPKSSGPIPNPETGEHHDPVTGEIVTASGKPVRKGLVQGCGAAAALVLIVGGFAYFGSQHDSGSSNSSTSSDDKSTVSEPESPPTQRPPSRLEEKRAFLATVDETISGARIAANPYKFVGKHVDLHCVVAEIPDPGFMNATCGTDENDLPVNIVIQAATTTLEKGQAIRVIGVVQDPMEGTNLMGGQTHFPTVQSLFME